MSNIKNTDAKYFAILKCFNYFIQAFSHKDTFIKILIEICVYITFVSSLNLRIKTYILNKIWYI